MVCGLRFAVCGLGFVVCGLGFVVCGLGFGVWSALQPHALLFRILIQRRLCRQRRLLQLGCKHTICRRKH
jgi:hypothetical protein